MGPTDKDYADKEWFAQLPEPLPPLVQFLDRAALAIGGLLLLAFALVVLSLVTS